MTATYRIPEITVLVNYHNNFKFLVNSHSHFTVMIVTNELHFVGYDDSMNCGSTIKINHSHHLIEFGDGQQTPLMSIIVSCHLGYSSLKLSPLNPLETAHFFLFSCHKVDL